MLLNKLKWLINGSSDCEGGFFENADAIRNVIGWSQVLFKTEVPRPLPISRAILIYADLWVETSVNTYLVSSSGTVVALRRVGLPYDSASSHLSPHPSLRHLPTASPPNATAGSKMAPLRRTAQRRSQSSNDGGEMRHGKGYLL